MNVVQVENKAGISLFDSQEAQGAVWLEQALLSEATQGCR